MAGTLECGGANTIFLFSLTISSPRMNQLIGIPNGHFFSSSSSRQQCRENSGLIPPVGGERVNFTGARD